MAFRRAFATSSSTAFPSSTSAPSIARVSQLLRLPDGRNLGFAEYGSSTGRPVFYLHGFPSSRLEGILLDKPAKAQNLRVICPDRPGFGQSTHDPARRLVDHPAQVLALANHLQLPRFAVLGCSGGGPYAIACARLLPAERLVATGVLSGAPIWERSKAIEDVHFQHMPFRARVADWMSHHAPTPFRLVLDGIVWLLQRVAGSGPAKRQIDAFLEKQPVTEQSIAERRDSLLKALLFEPFAQGTAGTVHEARLLSSPWGFEPEDVTAAVKIWHGTRDVNAPIAMTRYLAGRLPRSQLKEYDEDHYTLSKKEQVEEILQELVQGAHF